MRAVIQRVSSARVSVGAETTGAIDRGLLVLLGVTHSDTDEDARWLADKIASLRVFEDESGRMNRSVVETMGGILVVSQFTLFASTRKGARPSYNDAAKPEHAEPLYENFVGHVRTALGRAVPTGRFGAMMRVELVNDGPVTLMIDSKLRE